MCKVQRERRERLVAEGVGRVGRGGGGTRSAIAFFQRARELEACRLTAPKQIDIRSIFTRHRVLGLPRHRARSRGINSRPMFGEGNVKGEGPLAGKSPAGFARFAISSFENSNDAVE